MTDREAVSAILSAHDDNVSAAARAMGVSPQRLDYWRGRDVLPANARPYLFREARRLRLKGWSADFLLGAREAA